MGILVERLRERAKQLGISNAEAARRAGLDERRYAHYASGRREPNLGTLLTISNSLETTPNWLMGVVSSDEKDAAKAELVERFKNSEIAAESQVAVGTKNFLISKIDARHGAFGLVPTDLEGAVVSNDFPCFTVREDLLDPRFLEWFSKTETFVSVCRQASVGSTNRVRNEPL